MWILTGDASCCHRRRGNRRRNSGSESFLPAGKMENQKDEPADECEQARGKSNQHEPTHHTERIKKLAIIVSVNDAWMRRAFVYFASVRIGDRSAQHH